jgi:hypothetical protein
VSTGYTLTYCQTTANQNRGGSHIKKIKIQRLASGFSKDISNFSLACEFLSRNLRFLFAIHKHLTKVVYVFQLCDSKSIDENLRHKPHSIIARGLKLVLTWFGWNVPPKATH